MTIEIFGAYSGCRKQQENFQESAISINTKAQGSMERLEHPPGASRSPASLRRSSWMETKSTRNIDPSGNKRLHYNSLFKPSIKAMTLCPSTW
jgi:hypothetical protein